MFVSTPIGGVIVQPDNFEPVEIIPAMPGTRFTELSIEFYGSHAIGHAYFSPDGGKNWIRINSQQYVQRRATVINEAIMFRQDSSSPNTYSFPVFASLSA